tara:strand:+ start:978 stop:1844 length:867 start_codon:yes stop_codon:yes gene_type:complete
MAKVIYSFYIDIPEKELDFFDKNIIKEGATPTNLNTKIQLKNNYQKLIDCKKSYADKIGVDFIMFEYDDNFKKYKEDFNKNYPYITSYNIVNFYKIHLLYELSKKYDDILYLDFDVVPTTDQSFFDVWDLSKGICVLENTDKAKKIENITEYSQTIRSPTSKYYNAQAMLVEKGFSPKNYVINTGIIGVNKEYLSKLKYFDNFDSDLNMMNYLRNDHGLFPKKIVDFFGYDNETLFSVKLQEHNVDVQWLDDKWHYFFDKTQFIPKGTKLIHAINKRFDIVWRFHKDA